MRDTELFQAALGLSSPWIVLRSEFDRDRKQLDLHIGFARGNRFACPACGAEGCGVHDVREKEWRHLNFFQHKTVLKASIPRGFLRQMRCEAGFAAVGATRAVEIAREMERIKVSDYVFPGQAPGKPFSNMTLLVLLKRMNAAVTEKWVDLADRRPITAHGFRATFRTWAEEVTGFPHAVIEEAMGHKVGGKVERAYRRTDVLVKRRELMTAWAEYCELERVRINLPLANLPNRRV